MKTKTKNLIYVNIVTIIALGIPAILLGKYIEAITFYFAHWFIREQFSRQYHHIVPAICRILTAAIMFFGLSFVLPLSWSLLSSIPICYFISWVGYVKKTSDVYQVKCNELSEKYACLKDKINTDVYKMTEDELRRYGQSKGLSEAICDTLVLRVIYNYRWVDIQHERNFSKDGIRYHKEKIRKCLNIKI